MIRESRGDVRISHPLCPTHVSSAATTQLAVAQQGEKIKTNKYKSTAEQHEAKFIPFVMASTGGIGPSSAKLLDEIILASRDIILYGHMRYYHKS